LIRTKNHQLLYDVGSTSMHSVADRVVLPFLRHMGVWRLDEVVISHLDHDHMSGLERLIQSLNIRHIWTSSPLMTHTAQSLCQLGVKWQWDGVTFKFIHPDQERIMTKNNMSCVLEITTSGGKVLLTGDIESSAEKVMIKNKVLDKITVLVAPHHGRSTSATQAFMEIVRPDIILVSDQYHKIDNRWLNDSRVRLPYDTLQV